jgi:hypothetical protein
LEEPLKLSQKLKAWNPYPDDIFTEASHEDLSEATKALENAGLVSDKIFGMWGRIVWDNACKKLEEIE